MAGKKASSRGKTRAVSPPVFVKTEQPVRHDQTKQIHDQTQTQTQGVQAMALETTTSEPLAPLPVASTDEQAAKIITKYTKWAAGLGLIPVPLFDLVTVGAVQAKMIYDLAVLYKQSPKEHAIKGAIGAVLGGHVSANVGYGMGVGLAKLIPGVGTLVGALATPAVAAATTQGLGKVFNAHFALGGTLLDFDAKEIRESLQKEMATSLT